MSKLYSNPNLYRSITYLRYIKTGNFTSLFLSAALLASKDIMEAFWRGFAENPACISHQECICADKTMRTALSERQIDEMIEDSFPASDPPSTY